MNKHEYLLNLIEQYQGLFSSEDACISSLLIEQLNEKQSIFDRKNFTGHITASALVLSEDACEILLINHKFLKMWLQPGGHVEGEDEIYKEAMREVREETALSHFNLHPWHLKHENLDIPFSIDSHNIPESIKKKEKAHIHHDFTYLFVGNAGQKIVKQIEEVEDAKWFKLNEVYELNTDIQKFIARIKKYI